MTFRFLLHLLILAVLCAAVATSPARAEAPAQAVCEPYRITSYAAEDYPGLTADGSTTTWAALDRGEPIAAASYNLPFGAYVEVADLGTYRVADRGHLGARHIDVLVPTHWEALQIGSSIRTVCVYPPGEDA